MGCLREVIYLSLKFIGKTRAIIKWTRLSHINLNDYIIYLNNAVVNK